MRLSNTENYPGVGITPYQEFSVENKTYYFTPGGFLYRKDPGTEEVGGFFLTNFSEAGASIRSPGLVMFSASKVRVRVEEPHHYYTGLVSPLLQGKPARLFYSFPLCGG